MFKDTGKNIPETDATLRLQQRQLLDGKRPVQMFPTGTHELPLPVGMNRVVNRRGAFHYNPKMITGKVILDLSEAGHENKFLMLGPFNKTDVVERLSKGEKLSFITEYTWDGVEIRTAVGTDKTVPVQKTYFELTKQPDTQIVVGKPPPRVVERITNG